MKFSRPPFFRAAIRPIGFSLSNRLISPQVIPNQHVNNKVLSNLLNRRWGLYSPATQIHRIKFSSAQEILRDGQIGELSFSNNTCPCLGKELMEDDQGPSFYILRDDLLHPLVNGNKSRKLDALLPLLEDHSVTDVVTCGGCQSAHATAIAVSCAERSLKSHLLLRGEQPEILTGYNLISTLYGNVTYVPRSKYAHREDMLMTHAHMVAGKDGCVLRCEDIVEASLKHPNSMNLVDMIHPSTPKNSQRKVLIVNEGAGDCIALLGMLRLACYLSQAHLLGRNRALKFVIDAGTGTTAVGLGLAAKLLMLPWEINAVTLADTPENHRKHEKRLIAEFARQFHPHLLDNPAFEADDGLVNWVERQRPRNVSVSRFGNVLEGEMELCQDIAQKTGILLDPIYTLAAFEMSTQLAYKEAEKDTTVIMLHTGGTLGMFGLAQRYKSCFHKLKDRTFCPETP